MKLFDLFGLIWQMLWILVLKLLGGKLIRTGKSVYSRYAMYPTGEAKDEIEGREG
jgi:hypothetical protein